MSRHVTGFITLGTASPPTPPEPDAVVVEYEEWHAADGDRPAVTGEPWSFLSLAEESEHLMAAAPADRTRLVTVAPPRYAFLARPLASGPSIWQGSRGVTAYEACGFRFAVDDPPDDGWLSGVATFRMDTYKVGTEAVVAAARQTLKVTAVHLVRFPLLVVPGQESLCVRGAPTSAESVDATAAVRVDHMREGATFHVTVALPAQSAERGWRRGGGASPPA